MKSYREVAGQTPANRPDCEIAPLGDGYAPPALMLIGDASAVILGLPGGGADGPYGMTEPFFEFAEDGEA